MINNESKNNPNYKHGLQDKNNPSKYSQVYTSWMNMKGRCLRKTHPKYHRYGGRGITVHQDWLNIDIFLEWAISNGWEPNFTLDRIDNDGNYCPENCRWISLSENSRKKSTTKLSINQAKEIREKLDKGVTPTDLAKEYKVANGTIWFIQNNFTHVGELECSKKIKEYNAKE